MLMKRGERAKQLRERGVDIAVVKLGAGGVVWVSAESHGFVPVYSVNAIDTVAAGDSFNGGLAVALSGRATTTRRRAIRFRCWCIGNNQTRCILRHALPCRP